MMNRINACLLLTILLLIVAPFAMATAATQHWNLMAGTTGGINEPLPHYDLAVTRAYELPDQKHARLGLIAHYASAEMETDYGILVEDSAPNDYRLVGGLGLMLSADLARATNLALLVEINTSFVLVDVTEMEGSSFHTPSDLVISTGRISASLFEGGVTLEFLPSRYYGLSVSVGGQGLTANDAKFRPFLRGMLRVHF